MTSRILILCATRLEMAAFMEDLGPDPVPVKPAAAGGIQIWNGRWGPVRYDVVVTGPGVFNAVQGLTAFLERELAAANPLPDYILHTGIAGVFPETGLSIGDVAVAETDRYLHTGVDTGGGLSEPLPFELLPGQAGTRQGIYGTDPKLSAACRDILTAALNCRVASGPFVTVSAITGTAERAEALYRACSPIMEAMEGAAAAHVAGQYGLPLVEIRAASNQVGERDKTRWDIGLATRRVGQICKAILDAGERL